MPRRFNTPLWSGLVLTIIGFLSYPLLFVRWPITRDVPWASFLVFVVALVLLIAGLRRAERKVVPSIVMVLGIAIMVLFTVGTLVLSRQLPQSQAAPAIGRKAPDFTLPDTDHRNVTLSQLTTSGSVLLIFYRGYW